MLDDIAIERIISVPILAKKILLEVLLQLLVRHCPRLQSWAISGETNDGSLRKRQKPCPNFKRNLGPTTFFQGFYLENVSSYHPMQFPGKLMNWTWKSNIKPNFWSDFRPFGPNLGSFFLFVSFTSNDSWTLFQGIILWNLKENYCTKLEEMATNLILDLILSNLMQIWAQKFFFMDFTSARS